MGLPMRYVVMGISVLLFVGCQYKEGFLVLPFIPSSWPVLHKISPYGIMMALGFMSASVLLSKEFKRLNIPQKLADNIVIVAVVFGIIGAKLFFLWETSSEWSGWDRMIELTFSGAGLTWYGGFILATLAIYIVIRRAGYKFLYMADIMTPMLALGYGFGRLGCLLSGDGCYGEKCPYNLPWPLVDSFPNGAAPWSEIVAKYGDPNVVVYNTPLYAATFSFILAGVFWKLRKKEWPQGLKFIIFIFMHSLYRFLSEFIRLNPRDVFGMTQAQFLSIILMSGCILFVAVKWKQIYPFLKGDPSWKQTSQT
ncbi:MAG: hypothetical protein D6767_06625 [Candidatus Hydrogenedentota bacterium]|nr:MAG: hypothetical protein D6767_06625 [Candidatus Hydrogenedentota bacterium]